MSQLFTLFLSCLVVLLALEESRALKTRKRGTSRFGSTIPLFQFKRSDVDTDTDHVSFKKILAKFSLAASIFIAPIASRSADTDGNGISSTTTETIDFKATYDDKAAAAFVEEVQKTRPLNSDEFIVDFESDSLGLGLTENIYKGFPVTTVSAIRDKALSDKNPLLKEGAIIIGVKDEIVDGQPMSKIIESIKGGGRPLSVKFRDPSRYFELLDSTAGPPLKLITTSYLPANARDAGAAEQNIYVQRLAMPPPEERRRASQLLDVMEIQYVAQVAGSDKIVDSSAERAPPGTSTGSIYYILGQRNGPPGKFPPGWDLTLRGMVVGEKRRITLPYTLAYGAKGVKDRNIPPYATLVYTVKLISLT